MTTISRDAGHETDALIRQVDRHLALLHARSRGTDLDLAGRIAACLRNLITGTAHASAADRARVRAGVRYFVARGSGRSASSLAAGRRVVNDIARRLGRTDLLVESVPGPAEGAGLAAVRDGC